MSEQELKESFKPFGEIREVKLMNGYAFIVKLIGMQTYEKPEDAETAVGKMDGESLGDSKLIVEIAGQRKKQKGPQSDDVCRECGGRGHW